MKVHQYDDDYEEDYEPVSASKHETIDQPADGRDV